MAYKPQRVQTGGSFGEWINGTIMTKDNMVRVVPDDKEKSAFTLLRKNCPKNLKAGKDFAIQVSEDHKEILAFRPLEGMCFGKVQKFAAAENAEPAPKEKEVDFVSKKSSKRVHYTRKYFTVILEITEGDFAGITVPYVLDYKFIGVEEEIEGKKRMIVALEGGGRTTDRLAELLDYSGAWDKGPAPFADNVLPMFEKRILRADKKFGWILKNGFVDTLFKQNAPVSESLSED
jgi:hypothetical protein